jgi:hypothetical protein
MCGKNANISMPSLLFAGVALIALATQGAASDDATKIEFDPSLVEAWKESEVALPDYPRESDLIAVALAPTDTLKLYVDARSVSRAADEVLRATLVIESPSGTRNVFFDGMRCETREYKTYGIGSAGKALVAVKDPKWQDIPRLPHNAFRFHLYKHYACDGRSTALDARSFVRRLRDAAPP